MLDSTGVDASLFRARKHVRPYNNSRSQHDLCGCVDFSAVGEAGIPTAAALGREVHEVRHGSEQVDATLLDVRSHSWMRGVEVPHRAVGVTSEDGNRGVLI